MLSSVDLPEPDEPTIATISPAATVKRHAIEGGDALVAHLIVARNFNELDQRDRHRSRRVHHGIVSGRRSDTRPSAG